MIPGVNLLLGTSVAAAALSDLSVSFSLELSHYVHKTEEKSLALPN